MEMAIIDVFPGSPTAIRDAMAAANEGDVLLVHKGVYHENVRIRGSQNNLRIVAYDKHRAVLDGRFELPEAFALSGVAGVEIDGFAIRNYLSGGIRIVNGKSHRILENEISEIGGNKRKGKPGGIVVIQSVGNLVMRNKIEQIGRAGAGNGILLRSSSGNWVIQNKVLNDSLHGVVICRGMHNAVIGNDIFGQRSDGIRIGGTDNTLILDNRLHRNEGNGVLGRGTNNFVIDSSMNNNLGNGLLFNSNYNLAFNNEIINNRLSGAAIRSDFNDIQQNRMERNERNGIWIDAPHTANFVFENRLRHNTPNNIKDRGRNNNILQNDRE
jgi:parallel beta-helix repeat protein